ncbi:hypothetical protein HK102_000527 [Quaeritorhiza haematococci]|nr:hypothetical protein HK102_000527 [Quaeritorhiza haematococci]
MTVTGETCRTSFSKLLSDDATVLPSPTNARPLSPPQQKVAIALETLLRNASYQFELLSRLQQQATNLRSAISMMQRDTPSLGRNINQYEPHTASWRLPPQRHLTLKRNWSMLERPILHYDRGQAKGLPHVLSDGNDVPPDLSWSVSLKLNSHPRITSTPELSDPRGRGGDKTHAVIPGMKMILDPVMPALTPRADVGVSSTEDVSRTEDLMLEAPEIEGRGILQSGDTIETPEVTDSIHILVDGDDETPWMGDGVPANSTSEDALTTSQNVFIAANYDHNPIRAELACKSLTDSAQSLQQRPRFIHKSILAISSNAINPSKSSLSASANALNPHSPSKSLTFSVMALQHQHTASGTLAVSAYTLQSRSKSVTISTTIPPIPDSPRKLSTGTFVPLSDPSTSFTRSSLPRRTHRRNRLSRFIDAFMMLMNRPLAATRTMSTMISDYLGTKKPDPGKRLSNAYEWVIWWGLCWQFFAIVSRMACLILVPIVEVFEKAHLSKSVLTIYFTAVFFIDFVTNWFLIPRLESTIFEYREYDAVTPPPQYLANRRRSSNFTIEEFAKLKAKQQNSLMTMTASEGLNATTMESNEAPPVIQITWSVQTYVLLVMDVIALVPWDLFFGWMGYQYEFLILIKLVCLYRLSDSCNTIQYLGKLILELTPTWDGNVSSSKVIRRSNSKAARFLHAFFAEVSKRTSSYACLIFFRFVVNLGAVLTFLHLVGAIVFYFKRRSLPDVVGGIESESGHDLVGHGLFPNTPHPQQYLYPTKHPWLTKTLLDNMSFWDQYTWGLQEAAGHSVLIFIDPTERTTILERLLGILFDLLDATVDAFLIAEIALLITKSVAFARTAYVERLDMISEYGNVIQVPSETIGKVKESFVTANPNGVYHREMEILAEFDPLLRAQIEAGVARAEARKMQQGDDEDFESDEESDS